MCLAGELREAKNHLHARLIVTDGDYQPTYLAIQFPQRFVSKNSPQRWSLAERRNSRLQQCPIVPHCEL